MTVGRRVASVSFVFDPEAFPGADYTARSLAVERVDEQARYPFEALEARRAGGSTYREDGVEVMGDAVYCAGHTILEDGRLFYVGGARYAYMSEPYEHEWGLDYARTFDPGSLSFSMVGTPDGEPYTMPLGRSWYPTAGRLPDGRVLVTGAYTDYSTDKCLGRACLNPQVNIYDPTKVGNPWSEFINKSMIGDEVLSYINPGIREYTRVFVLPTPVTRAGHERQVLMMGKAGKVVLLNIEDGTPMEERLHFPPNGTRPGGGSDESGAVPLLTNGGEIMITGGYSGEPGSPQRIDVYDVLRDQWRSYDTGIRRAVPATLLLPDGRVLLMSGENGNINQVKHATSDAQEDPRYPQIFDPEEQEPSRAVVTEHARSVAYRGYHNMAALLKDGRILVGGGFEQHGDVGCENPNLHIYSPSYLRNLNDRLVIDGADTTHTLDFNASPDADKHTMDISYTFSRFPLDASKGVALLASQAFTHSYGENQRYVRLKVLSSSTDGSRGSITAELPHYPVIFPGQYLLFLTNTDGAPSVARHVVLKRSSAPVPPARPTPHKHPATAATTTPRTSAPSSAPNGTAATPSATVPAGGAPTPVPPGDSALPRLEVPLCSQGNTSVTEFGVLVDDAARPGNDPQPMRLEVCVEVREAAGRTTTPHPAGAGDDSDSRHEHRARGARAVVAAPWHHALPAPNDVFFNLWWSVDAGV